LKNIKEIKITIKNQLNNNIDEKGIQVNIGENELIDKYLKYSKIKLTFIYLALYKTIYSVYSLKNEKELDPNNASEMNSASQF